MSFTHASLFSGIGGFDLAAEWVGWKNVFHCEINEFCAQILKYHFPNADHYEDIKTTDFTKWRGKINVLSGGFPCQPFSLAWRRKGADVWTRANQRTLWNDQLLLWLREWGSCLIQKHKKWGENVAMDRGKSNLTDEIANIYKPAGRNSQLNPLFVEEMMGFPLMWTTLPYLSRSGERNQSRPTETP